MTNKFNGNSLASILALQDSPMNRVMKQFEDSPMNRMMKQFEDSPMNQMMKQFEDSPMNQMMKQLEDSPMNQMMKQLEDSPMNRMMKQFEDSPMNRMIKEAQNSKILNVFGAIENSNVMGGLSHVLEQLKNDCGELTFTEAYKLFSLDYEECSEESAIDELTENIKYRAVNAPPGNLSSEFYLSLIIAFILFYISYMSAIESEEKMLNKIGGLEDIITTQLHEINQASESSDFLVADRSLNLRAGSGTDHPVIGNISKNQKLLELDRHRDWVKVEYFDHINNVNLIGWAHSRYLIQFAVNKSL